MGHSEVESHKKPLELRYPRAETVLTKQSFAPLRPQPL